MLPAWRTKPVVAADELPLFDAAAGSIMTCKALVIRRRLIIQSIPYFCIFFLFLFIRLRFSKIMTALASVHYQAVRQGSARVPAVPNRYESMTLIHGGSLLLSCE